MYKSSFSCFMNYVDMQAMQEENLEIICLAYISDCNALVTFFHF